jgi:amino acid transporter
MRATEYFTLAFGSMIGVGWVILIDDWLRRGGPMGAMLGFLVGGLGLVPVGYAYGRLTERLPDAGSEIAYTSAVFTRGVSFGTGWMLVLAYLFVCPWEAVALGQLFAYLFPQMDAVELYRVAGYPVYLPHLAVGLALIIGTTLINHRGIRLSATFQNLTTFGLLAIFGVFTILGLTRGTVANWQPLFADDRAVLGGFLSTLLVLQIVPYYLMGFETIPKCSEEAAADFNPRHFVGVTLLALGVGVFFYVAVAGVVASLQPWTELTKAKFATAVAFERAFGSPFLVRLILVGAILSLLKVFNGNFLAATRLLFAMGRRGLLDARLGQVHDQYGTPTHAIFFVGTLSVLTALLGKAVLVPITEVGSLAITVGWLATCLAFCWGAGGSITWRAWLIGVCGAMVATVLLVMKLIPAVPGSFSLLEFVALAVWVVLGFVLWSR